MGALSRFSGRLPPRGNGIVTPNKINKAGTSTWGP